MDEFAAAKATGETAPVLIAGPYTITSVDPATTLEAVVWAGGPIIEVAELELRKN